MTLNSIYSSFTDKKRLTKKFFKQHQQGFTHTDSIVNSILTLNFNIDKWWNNGQRKVVTLTKKLFSIPDFC